MVAVVTAATSAAQPAMTANGGLERDLHGATAVVIRVALDSSGQGTFLLRTGITDTGTATSRRSVARGRMQLVTVLTSSSGTIAMRVTRRCGSKTSTWRAVHGTGIYAGVTGQGTGTGRTGCGRSRASVREVYRGALETASLPALAEPGIYGGWTSQGERVTFQVQADGRHVSDLRVERLATNCTPALEVVLHPAFVGAYEIASDGSFSITAADSTISGRFDGSTATGSIAPTSSSQGTCSTPVTWSASTPPPPLPFAPPGTYCGSTSQNLGACVTLAAGQSITYLRVEVGIDCFSPESAQFIGELSFGGPVPLRSNSTFELPGSLAGSAGGDYYLQGGFDNAGNVSGTVTVRRVSFDLEYGDGELTVYTCRDVSFSWSAKRLT
jgi:hypothetical protein